MQVRFRRGARDSCEITVRRDDGVVLHASQRVRRGATPHDLVHFAVEETLELREGFWGCVAAGAEFKSFERVAGRRRPHAGERSREILGRARRQLTTAEVLAGTVERLAREHWDNDPPRLMREVERQLSNCEAPESEISGERIADACAALRDYERRWGELPVDRELVADWPPMAVRAQPGRRRR